MSQFSPKLYSIMTLFGQVDHKITRLMNYIAPQALRIKGNGACSKNVLLLHI